ncbi:H-type lectin domain-containing protein [Pseudooceanicola nanhaiensis]|uniref:H-type lectin domain-containing protein n=1 Tax=Pseudooceanicola nanhaiensis TaxID=375761 RepID=UPI001CD50570|nr:H-type lectin domain-containing protein [Pseudooceanicola nanhaiensis]MCA0922175.1 H-type lectin domain-containing protein [Pseudooceanicola nanhaiensis]
MTIFNSTKHVFSINDLTATFDGLQYPEDPSFLDTAGAVVDPYVDRDGNVLYGIDSEFGFYVQDFIGAVEKELDGDFAEGYAGNIYDDDGNVIGLALRDAETDMLLSGAPLGTWSLGLGGVTVKASTEHYITMASVLSDQAYPGDESALGPLDNDLKMRDLRPTEVAGVFEVGALHDAYVHELVGALQSAIDATDPALNSVRSDIDFDRDGVLDTYRITKTAVDYDVDGDGTPETLLVGAVDIGNDGSLDIVDSFLNGYGGEADLTDLLQPNETDLTYNIAYGQDYSVTLKDDGKLLYRWGEAVKRPNDIRMEVNLDLPDEWTVDADDNGIADSLEDGSGGFIVTRAELVITHEVTNNPNDQVRPEDYENEAAIGRLPSYYVVVDPDDSSNTLWVSPVDSYDGVGDPLPSYFVLDAQGHIDLSVGGTAVYDPDGVLVGYRNEDASGTPVGTVLKDASLAAMAAAAELDFSTTDLDVGYTAAWYTTTDREPFEWSYDAYPDNPFANVYESFRSPEDAAAAGYGEEALVSGPRWRLTANKFGQDLPGLEIPLIPNSEPPYTSDNIKYDTGDTIVTTLNLLDWAGDSPLATSAGWMTIDPTRLDVDADGVIDAGWSQVNGALGAGDAVPAGLILSAVTPNGVLLEQNFFDTAVYLKGDRQDDAQIYDIQLVLEYGVDTDGGIGTVQQVAGLTDEARTVTYFGHEALDAPVLFATPATLNGVDAVTVEFSEITGTSATLYLEEADIHDGVHRGEDVTLLALEEGSWALADGSLLQVGTTVFEAGATNVFHSVTFDTTFAEAPVVILQVQTNNGPQWEVVRTGEISTTGFTYAVQEQEASDGWHGTEVIGWAALDAISADGIVDWGDIAAQAFNTGRTVSSTPTEFEFAADVGTAPLISADLASYYGGDAANLRLADLTSDGTTATAEFVAYEEVSHDLEMDHFAEVVNGIAFDSAGLLLGSAVVDEFLFV